MTVNIEITLSRGQLDRNRTGFNYYEPFGLGRFATDHSQTQTALRSLFVRLIHLASD